MLTRTLGPKTEAVTAVSKKLCNEELHYLHSLHVKSVIRSMWRINCVQHVQLTGGKCVQNFMVEYLTEGDHMRTVDEDCEILKVYQTN